MRDSIVFESGMGELGLGIEGVLRRAARSLIGQAIETAVSVLLEEFSAVRMVNGRQAVVRNGHLPEREIITALVPVHRDQFQDVRSSHGQHCWQGHQRPKVADDGAASGPLQQRDSEPTDHRLRPAGPKPVPMKG